MPYQYLNRGHYLYLRMLGVVTRQDLSGCVRELEDLDDASPVAPHRAVDLTGTEGFEVDFQATLSLAQRRRSRVLKNPVKSALIARRDIEIGFARMFQTLNDHPQIEIRIVKSVEEAEAWFAGIDEGPRSPSAQI
jgi:hypothetical protein